MIAYNAIVNPAVPWRCDKKAKKPQYVSPTVKELVVVSGVLRPKLRRKNGKAQAIYSLGEKLPENGTCLLEKIAAPPEAFAERQKLTLGAATLCARFLLMGNGVKLRV